MNTKADQGSAALLAIDAATFVERLPAALWAKGLDGRYLIANPACCQFVGLPDGTAMIGRSDEELFKPEDAAVFQANDQAVVASGTAQQFFECVDLGSVVRHVVSFKFPLRDESGDIMAVCGICFDQTERELLQQSQALLHDQVTAREQQLLTLSRSAVIDAGDRSASLALICQLAMQGLGVARVSVWLWNDKRDAIHCVHLVDEQPTADQPAQPGILRADYPQYFAALDSARTLAANDARQDPRTAELTTSYLDVLNIGAMLDTPIRLVGETAGVLCCEVRGSNREWQDAELAFASALAEAAGRAMVAEQQRKAERSLRELNQTLEARVARETAAAQAARQQAEAARQQLQDITDHMPGAVGQLLWRGPGDLQFLYISDGITRITGLPMSAFQRNAAAALSAVHCDDLPGLLAAIDIAAQRATHAFEHCFRVIHQDTRSLLWIQLQARGQTHPNGVLFNGSFADISQSKQLESQLAESERLLKAAFVASLDGIWEWNLETDEVFYSDSWFRQLGYAPGELPQKLETFSTLCHPDDVESIFAAVAATIESAEQIGYSSEFRLRHKNGQWLWLLGRGNVSLRDEDGHAIRLTGTNTDIDERKRLEQSLAIASRQAQAASKAKSDFLANMSHEIRTPMNAVLGLAELLDKTTLDAKQRGYLNNMMSASRTLLSLINNVLDLSKIEAGKFDVERHRFNVPSVLHDLLSLLKPQAEAKRLKLILRLSPGMPQAFMGDGARISQVLLNLIGNAIKFTAQGSVTIRSHWEYSRGQEGRLKFSVEDQGVGISTDRIETLFQPFVQEDSSISRRFGGSGLGLAICQQLVSLMDGDIGVESQPGVGSTFWFSVPLTACELTPADLADQAAVDTSALRGLRVLVAEDNDINLEILTELLTRLGIEVRAARNGGEAVAACADGWPQLVLMDMQMPVVDGLQATAMLREDARFAELPIIALTANVMSEDRALCLAAGMSDYLSKPIEVEQLHRCLLRWQPDRRH